MASSPALSPAAYSDSGRNGDSRTDRLRRRQSTSGTAKDSRQSTRGVPASEGPDRSSAILVRKRLPWLDSPNQSPTHDTGIPGNGNVKAQTTTLQTARVVAGDTLGTAAEATVRAQPIDADPALRATGSTPSLRQHSKTYDNETLSLNSRRLVKKPLVLKAGLAAGTAPRVGYTTSEYSTTPSSDASEPPLSLPRKLASSYERLVDGRDSNTIRSQDRSHMRDTWTQSAINLPTESHPSPRTSVPTRHTTLEADASLATVSGSTTTPVRRGTGAMLPESASQSIPPRGERRRTLFAIPDHLLPSSSSSSSPLSCQPTEVRASSVQAPPLVLSRQSRCRQSPSPQLSAGDQSQSLERAVTGLGNLMQEALDVASDAAKKGRNEEVANIFDNATVALRHASTVNDQIQIGRMSGPLRLSSVESGRGSEGSLTLDSDMDSLHTGRQTIETAPTIVTRSAQSSQQPLILDPFKDHAYPVSRRASVHDRAQITRRHSTDSIARTPPRLYQPPSADSIVRDFAYTESKTLKPDAARLESRSYGAASDFYGDTGQSIVTQPGVRSSLSTPMFPDERPPIATTATARLSLVPPASRRQDHMLKRVEPVPTRSAPTPALSSRLDEPLRDQEMSRHRMHPRGLRRHHISNLFESSQYHQHARDAPLNPPRPLNSQRAPSQTTETRYAGLPDPENKMDVDPDATRYSDVPAPLLQRDISLRHPRRAHVSIREGQGFSLGRFHRRAPIAREWSTHRKRITATIACANTVFIGLICGIYAGEVPRIQWSLGDSTHKVILGNVVLFSSLGLVTCVFWPLPLLHGRKPYTLFAFAVVLPLMFPQAMIVGGYHNPNNPLWRCGLLIPRAFLGVAMGFANINFLPTLLDLFGASLMSLQPHQEIVVYDDVRRQGGGIGIWLGIWSFCFVGSMSIGFCIGAVIISALNPSWGFYVIVILLALFLFVNVIAPETRRSPYRRSIAQFIEGHESGEEKVRRRVARGEVKLHISNEGPKWWFNEVWAGLILTKRMASQPGFFVLMCYLGWMYAQVTLVILLLGALLSRDYMWRPHFVGLAVLSVAIGAGLAVPLSKANLFSRARDTPQRTDSMTMRHTRVHWSSHMLRRCAFTLILPFGALGYTLSSPGPSINWAAPTTFCGLVGFLSNLAIAECVGLIMETFDTCDLQPGVNQKHRLQSMAETTRRRRTNYSSFPRICAGFFAAQGLGFFLSAAATGVSGDVTRAVGAQTATAIVAAVLLGLTVLFIIVLWRWREVQVIPNHAFGTQRTSLAWGSISGDAEWKPVIIGNPSGKLRRMNILELGELSRWTEIRKLNKLKK